MRIPFLAMALLCLVLQGCTLLRPPAADGQPSAAGSAPAKAALAAEQRRLAELFRDTPVDVSLQPDGSMRVTVPLAYSFDKGRRAVKPALGKVLDLVARSQRSEATRFLVAAPADPRSKGLMLATERATSARDYMVARGVAATRFSVSALGSGDAVVVVVADLPAH